ncbi:MAG: DUF2357 domain-containing protein, partial [Bacteroidota bacterium]
MPRTLTLETRRLRVVWTGEFVETTGPLTRMRATRGDLTVTASGARGPVDSEGALPLAVPEEARLSVLVESRTGEPVAVTHRDPSQVRRLVSTDGGRVLHGTVAVRDEVGLSTFRLRVGASPEAEVALAVVPVKVTAADLDAMRADVTEAWAGAARSAWGRTASGAEPGGDTSRPAWLDLLRSAVASLDGPLAAIARRPEADIRVREHDVPATRLRADARGVRALRRGRGRGPWQRVGSTYMRETVRASAVETTEDVAAHRWLRVKLDRARRALAQIRREEAEHAWPEHARTAGLLADLDILDSHLRRLARQRPLAAAEGACAPAGTPLVLRRRPAYRQAFDALRLLETGLGIASGEVETAWLGTARLYETWAALRTVQTLADVLGVAAPEAPFGAEAVGARVRVGRGASRAVRLQNGETEVEVAYEPRFGAGPGLLAQRPDLLLTLRRPSEPPRRAVLDAKYRHDDSPGYARRHGAPGPPEDALGDLHRYRDAIVDASGERLIERAAALYPHRAARGFEGSRLWRAHADVGVGAIPL